MRNPFIISTYHSPEYFCDREKETGKIISSLKNNRNTLLMSYRRMGKTGLIKHCFYHLSNEKNIALFYFDIMQTTNLNEFVNKLGNSLLGSFDNPTNKFYNRLIKFFSRFNPVITFDSISGQPNIEFQFTNTIQTQNTIEEIFNYLEKQNKHIIIAIDEFQQITKYPEKNVEAFLRSYIQHLNNTNFIFSGSSKHILINMFTNSSRPFYQSSDILNLDRLPKDIYTDFIHEKFDKSRKHISTELISELIDWADNHTFYVQYIFNKLFAINQKSIKSDEIELVKKEILIERESIYLSLINLLTTNQFNLLKTIAKEGVVSQPNSKKIISKYGLGTPSSVSTALKALMQKEIIYKEKEYYKVYDVFFSKWLKMY